MSVTVTEKAANEIRRVLKEQNLPEADYVLEVGVAGGGCSGFSYKLGFKKRAEVDALNETTFTHFGLDAAVNNKALPFIDGTTVDFHDGLDKRGFTFNNPQATKGCGCGNSFGVG